MSKRGLVVNKVSTEVIGSSEESMEVIVSDEGGMVIVITIMNEVEILL